MKTSRMVAMTALAVVLVASTYHLAQAAPGDLDPTFGVGGVARLDFGGQQDSIRSVAERPGGRFVVAGFADGFTDTSFGLAQYLPDGTLDEAFGANGKVKTSFVEGPSDAYDVLIQHDAKVVVGGWLRNDLLGTSQDFALARYHANGSLDTGFGVQGKVIRDFDGGPDYLRAISLLPDGRILAVGGVNVGGQDHVGLLRYLEEGTPDDSFGNQGVVLTYLGGSQTWASSVADLADGSILVVGSIVEGAAIVGFVLKYGSDGVLDPAFGGGDGVMLFDLAERVFFQSIYVQPDGRIVVGGTSGESSASEFLLIRLQQDGDLDASFGGSGWVTTQFTPDRDLLSAISPYPGGYIVAIGSSCITGSVTSCDARVALYDSTGNLEPSFGVGGSVVTDLAEYSNLNTAFVTEAASIVAAGRSGPSPSDFTAYRYEGLGSICGNEIVEEGEDCDDREGCCTWTCQFVTPGSSCEDADLCNGSETCDGAGACLPGSPLDCSDQDLCTQDSCDALAGCINSAEPATTCISGWEKGSLLVKESVPGKEKLVAKLAKGPAIDLSAFGNPVEIDGTRYQACIYDEAGTFVESLEVDRAGLACAGSVCWRAIGPRTYLYKDKEISADGVQMVRILAGPEDKTQILLKAKNNSKKGQLDLPVGIAASLAGSSSATVQLFGDDAPECFSLTFDEVKKSEVDLFKAVKR